VIVCYGDAPEVDPLGLRVSRRLGASVIFTGSPDRTSVDARLQEVAAKLTADGRHPYVIPRGGASAVGAVGYAAAAFELADQMEAAGVPSATLLLSTGSCGTQAGLIAGASMLGVRTPPGPPLRVVGVPVSRPPDEVIERVARLATGCAERLGCDLTFGTGDVHLLDGYLGPGYGQASPEGDEAALLAARTEGILMDPVFTAKAMAALVSEARNGRLAGPVVFLHTGGAPAALGALP
jgi:D-cysteine desulfhydrase